MPSVFLTDFPGMLFHAVSSLFALDGSTTVIPAHVCANPQHFRHQKDLKSADWIVWLFLLHHIRTYGIIPFSCYKVLLLGIFWVGARILKACVDCEITLCLTTEEHTFTGCTFTCPVALSFSLPILTLPSIHWAFHSYHLSQALHR